MCVKTPLIDNERWIKFGAFDCAAITEMYSSPSKELSRDQYQGLELVGWFIFHPLQS